MIFFLLLAPSRALGSIKLGSAFPAAEWTGEVTARFETDGCGIGAASRRRESRHFQSGVVSASKSEPPRTIRDEPRKRRRTRFICWAPWESFGARFPHLP